MLSNPLITCHIAINTFDTAVDASDNRRKFSGKELITDKGYDAYDFEARPLTLTIPRFTQSTS